MYSGLKRLLVFRLDVDSNIDLKSIASQDLLDVLSSSTYNQLQSHRLSGMYTLKGSNVIGTTGVGFGTRCFMTKRFFYCEGQKEIIHVGR